MYCSILLRLTFLQYVQYIHKSGTIKGQQKAFIKVHQKINVQGLTHAFHFWYISALAKICTLF